MNTTCSQFKENLALIYEVFTILVKSDASQNNLIIVCMRDFALSKVRN